MRSVDKVLNQSRTKANTAKRAQPEDPDEVEIRIERMRAEPVNSPENVFDRDLSKRFGGINTAPSVFDKGAIFRTSSGSGPETDEN